MMNRQNAANPMPPRNIQPLWSSRTARRKCESIDSKGGFLARYTPSLRTRSQNQL
jgi:hypothetical protein